MKISSRFHNRDGESVQVLKVGTGKASGSQLAEVRYANGETEQVFTGNLVRSRPAGANYLDGLRADLANDERALRKIRGTSALDVLSGVSGERPSDVAQIQKEARRYKGTVLGDRLEQAAQDLELIRRGNAGPEVLARIKSGKSVSPQGGQLANQLTGAAALDATPAKVRDGKLNLPGWSEADRSQAATALEHYRDIGFSDLNRDLRAGVPGSATGRGTTATIDRVMAASPLPAPATVYRGVSDARFLDVGEAVDPTFGSATADLGVAKGFGRGGAVLRMRVPAGVGAVNLSDMPGVGKADEREGELLLQRGLRYRRVGETVENGVRIIDVEVTPGPIAPVRAAGRTPGTSRPTGPPKLNRSLAGKA